VFTFSHPHYYHFLLILSLFYSKQKIKSKRILVVDDEPDITLTLQVCLEPLGYEVHSYNDSVLALENFKAGMYDLVILDIRMPIMNGYQFI
jgi:CheY-like chemotaxis protein